MPRKTNFDDIAGMQANLKATSRGSVLLFFFIISASALGQTDRYIIRFKDKTGTPYSLQSPQDFLSPRALARREKNGVAVTEADLPVSPVYVQALRPLVEKVLYSSRWLNATLVEANAQEVEAASALSFVQSIERVAASTIGTFTPADVQPEGETRQVEVLNATQLNMIGLDQMHADGWQGDGVMVAVMDSGFPSVNTALGFKDLFESGRIADTYNFAWQRKDVYGFDSHGASVLSILAADLPGTFRGGLPKATYLLYVTEFVPTEFRVEEFNWVFAAERADSVGADVINTSLGYTTFDDASMDYAYSDMTGEHAVISRAAGMAAQRGMVVVVSAGNLGSDPWLHIGAPADQADVLSVGAVDANGKVASFSSRGPAADGRIKPDVSAMGSQTVYLAEGKTVATGSGTSFSAPLVASLAGGLLQSKPDITAAEIRERIRAAGSIADNPDNILGFGIPTYNKIRLVTGLNTSFESPVAIYPNPAEGDFMRVDCNGVLLPEQCTLISSGGSKLPLSWKELDRLGHWSLSTESWNSGLYVLQLAIRTDSGQVLFPVVKVIKP